jgi:SPP1 family predicted phage head-tail adaptor
MIRAGDFKKRIVLQKGTETKNSLGHVKETWTTLAEDIPAIVKPIGGREKFREGADRELSFMTSRFTIRFREDVSTRTRILYDGKTWDVVYVSEVGNREGLELVADVVK